MKSESCAYLVKMKFNENKIVAVLFRWNRYNKIRPIKLFGVQINWSFEAKYFGLIVYCRPNFYKSAQNITKKSTWERGSQYPIMHKRNPILLANYICLFTTYIYLFSSMLEQHECHNSLWSNGNVYNPFINNHRILNVPEKWSVV